MEHKRKNSVLSALTELIRQHRLEIIEANRTDIGAFPEMEEAMIDRLKVDDKKIEGMIRSLEEVAAQTDPEGKTIYEFVREDGLHIVNRTVPFGTILIIYESRPDVTIEAAATAFKAGNRILLKGGKEAFHTNTCLTRLWQQALSDNGADKSFIQYLSLTHEETQQLIRENSRKVDLIIPRGGERLIRFVQENTSVPVIISGRGNNFLYVESDVDFDMATGLIMNGKKRISVCNAIDKVIIDKKLPALQEKINTLATILLEKGIEVWGNSGIVALSDKVKEENDAATLCEEYLAPKLYLTLADDITEAIGMINSYSGGHSAVIVTNNRSSADQFMQQVDCAAVYHNASSRFTDGGQFGVGAEIAISTQKLHFRGPLGAQELVTNKWFVYGEGHIRE